MTTETAPRKRTIRAIFIDAINETVTDLRIEPTLEKYYELLKCRTIQMVPYTCGGDFLVIDEEGRLNDPEYFFSIDGGHPFVGNCLIVGDADEYGNETSCTLYAKDLEVTFLRKETQGFDRWKIEVDEMTAFAEGTDRTSESKWRELYDAGFTPIESVEKVLN